MDKNEVYSWRIPRETRLQLEEAARRRGVPLAVVLDEIARQWLEEERAGTRDGEAEQARIRAAAMRAIGKVKGGDTRRAEQARQTIRKKLAGRRAG